MGLLALCVSDGQEGVASRHHVIIVSGAHPLLLWAVLLEPAAEHITVRCFVGACSWTHYCALFCWSLQLNTLLCTVLLEPAAEHISPSSKKVKNAWNFDWNVLCLHVDQPASGSEERGSQFMQNTENFFMLCFVCSQLGAGQGNTSPQLRSNIMSSWGIRCFTKSKF
jgi:hypothetical protein